MTHFLDFARWFIEGCLLFVAVVTLKGMKERGELNLFWTVMAYIGAAAFLIFDFLLNLLLIVICLRVDGWRVSRRVENTIRRLGYSSGKLSWLEDWQLHVATWWRRQIQLIDPTHFEGL